LTPKTDVEILNDLDDYVSDIREKEVDGILKRISESTLTSYTFVPESAVNWQQDKKNMKALQKDNEIIIVEQKNFHDREQRQTNWIYLSGLPYELASLGYDNVKAEIVSALKTKDGVKEIVLNSYEEFLDRLDVINRIQVPEDIKSVFNAELAAVRFIADREKGSKSKLKTIVDIDEALEEEEDSEGESDFAPKSPIR
jgi:hypothetical protein